MALRIMQRLALIFSSPGNGKVLTGDTGVSEGASWQTSLGGPPSGAAGGDLAGTFPSPTLSAAKAATFDAAGAATTAAAAAQSAASSYADAAVAAHAAAANPHPGYVLATDTRLTDARTPTAHASTHETRGSDRITAENLQHSSTSKRASCPRNRALLSNDRRRM